MQTRDSHTRYRHGEMFHTFGVSGYLGEMKPKIFLALDSYVGLDPIFGRKYAFGITHTHVKMK